MHAQCQVGLLTWLAQNKFSPLLCGQCVLGYVLLHDDVHPK